MHDSAERQWRGSVCTGILTSEWPFGKLSVGPEAIDLRSLLGRLVIPREKIQFIERGGFLPWLWTGIRIRHACVEYPERLMFSPTFFWRRTEILSYAESLGYNVR